MGGLVMGRSYDNGGIVVAFKFGNHYMLDARVEGGEFVVNAEASAFNHNRLALIKANLLPGEAETASLSDVHLLVTDAQPDDKILWLQWGATAIPAEIATKHMGELFRLNRERNPFLKCDLLEAFCLRAAMSIDPLEN
jgi:hypothetical protein